MTFARYGGIRIPSELVELRWKHVYFLKGQVLIHSPKTEHHTGKGTRLIPLFDEMRKPLMAAFTLGVKPYDFVITKPHYRHPDANLRQQFLKLARTAGVTPWGKTFQNLRASRETELIERIGLKEACEIIGNSEIVALRHYQMLRPQFIESAVIRDREARKAARNAAHPMAKLIENDWARRHSLLADRSQVLLESAFVRQVPLNASELQMDRWAIQDSKYLRKLKEIRAFPKQEARKAALSETHRKNRTLMIFSNG